MKQPACLLPVHSAHCRCTMSAGGSCVHVFFATGVNIFVHEDRLPARVRRTDQAGVPLQWLSCSNFFYQYFRVYSPVSFGQKYDKEGAFVRHFLPVLKDMPAKYIYEPWKAPKDVQEKANCIIGKDYPEPIVDHGEASKENKQKMKDAYAAHKSNSSGTQSTPSKRKAND